MGPVVPLRKEEWKSQRPEPHRTNKETINLYIILQVAMLNRDKERNGKRYHEGNWVLRGRERGTLHAHFSSICWSKLS